VSHLRYEQQALGQYLVSPPPSLTLLPQTDQGALMRRAGAWTVREAGRRSTRRFWPLSMLHSSAAAISSSSCTGGSDDNQQCIRSAAAWLGHQSMLGPQMLPPPAPAPAI